MSLINPTELSKEIKDLQATARYKIIQDYFGKFYDSNVVASCYTRDDAEFLVKSLNKVFENRPFDFRYELVDIYNEELDKITSDLFAIFDDDKERHYWTALKDCESALSKQQIDNHIDEADNFCVPGNIGGKAYIILQDGVNRHIAEGIITDITARKRNDSFAVKFIVNYEEGLCITRKEFLYGIDAFITPEEARVGLALMEI